jgi:hypothetical protein
MISPERDTWSSPDTQGAWGEYFKSAGVHLPAPQDRGTKVSFGITAPLHRFFELLPRHPGKSDVWRKKRKVWSVEILYKPGQIKNLHTPDELVHLYPSNP